MSPHASADLFVELINKSFLVTTGSIVEGVVHFALLFISDFRARDASFKRLDLNGDAP